MAKLLLAEISPFMLAGLLHLGAAIGLGTFEALRGLSSTPKIVEAAISRAYPSRFAATILAGGVVAPVLLIAGLVRTPASSGALLLNLEGLSTMVIARVVFRENIDRLLLVGAAAIPAGAIVLSWTGTGVSLDLGGLLGAGACIAWGIDNNLTRRISAAGPVRITVWKGLIAGSVDIGLASGTDGTLPSPMLISLVGLLGFFAVGVSLVLFIRALRHLGSARTGAHVSLAPFIGAVLAVGLLGEAVTLRLAAPPVAIGLWLHPTERHEHDGPVSEPHSHLHCRSPVPHPTEAVDLGDDSTETGEPAGARLPTPDSSTSSVHTPRTSAEDRGGGSISRRPSCRSSTAKSPPQRRGRHP